MNFKCGVILHCISVEIDVIVQQQCAGFHNYDIHYAIYNK